MRHLYICLLAASVAVTFVAGSRADTGLDVNWRGESVALVNFPRTTPFDCGLWLVRDGWKTLNQPWSLQDIQWRHDDSGRWMHALWRLNPGRAQVVERVEANRIDYEFTAIDPIPEAGVFWFASIPVSGLSGGTVLLDGQAFKFPAIPPPKGANAFLFRGRCRTATLTSADGSTRIVLRFDQPRTVIIQDGRVFGADAFQLFFRLQQDDGADEVPLPALTTFRASVTTEAALPADNRPVDVAIDSAQVGAAFDGVGGDFVYSTDSPVTQITLHRLPLTWARVGMDLTDWADDRSIADPAVLDTPGSALRRRFELDRQVYAKCDGRMIASVWFIPEWFYAQPIAGRRTAGDPVPRDRWDALAKTIVSYLRHEKQDYGVEPRLFSFNESDYGVYVRLSAADMHDLIIQLGQAFEAAGLKTRLLLGDSASATLGWEQIQPTLNDPEAMKYVGALAYHAWTDEPATHPSWAAAAEKAKLPLLLTEVGADSQAWIDDTVNSPLNALRYMRRFIGLVRESHANALLEWEYTGDYPLLTPGTSGETSMAPTARFGLLSLFDLPPGQRVVATHASLDVCPATALVGNDGALSVFIFNASDARRLQLRGLPATISHLAVAGVDANGKTFAASMIESHGGEADFEIPAATLVRFQAKP